MRFAEQAGCACGCAAQPLAGTFTERMGTVGNVPVACAQETHRACAIGYKVLTDNGRGYLDD
jgi:hypothetical protein